MPTKLSYTFNPATAQALIRKIPKTRIMVVGDLMIDEFIWGTVSRISPEAPVPVVNVNKQSYTLGGAANVVNNLRALGGKVMVAGIVGDDTLGEKLLNRIVDSGAEPVAVIKDEGRLTTLKTRVVAHHQQVVRIDRETVGELPLALQKRLIASIEKNIPKCDAIIIEDYAKGVINKNTLKSIIRIAKKHKKIVSVDPKVYYKDEYQGVDILTPNHHEAGAFAGIQVKDEASLIKVARKLLKELPHSALLITRGEEGMSLFESNGVITHIPTRAKEVYDVSGAGDTVIGTLTAIMAAGGKMQDAAFISNYAAGIVVGKMGVATCSPEELIKALVE